MRETDEEIETHLALRIEELRRLGMSEAEAEAEARRRFGDPEGLRAFAAARAGRRARRLAVARWLSEFIQDVHVALRQFGHAPALGLLVVLTLGLSIGATTATYGVIRHVLLAPLPYPHGNRIVSLQARGPTDGKIDFGIGTDLFGLWMERSRTLQDVAADRGVKEPRDSVSVLQVTPSFLPVLLRVRPSLGRTFVASDTAPGAPRVAMIGDSLWRARFGGARDVLGRAIVVNGVPRTIVGVVPAGVTVPEHGQPVRGIWLPLSLGSVERVFGFARLRPGASAGTASREMQAIMSTLPDTGRLHRAHAQAVTPQDMVDPNRRSAVQVLFAAAAGLLLIACADVAGLLLMRGWERRREFAIRRALGARRPRLARQLFTESLLLALPSGVLGLLVVWSSLRAMATISDGVRARPAMLLWTMALAVGTALLFGMGPAFLAGRQSLDPALRTGGPTAGGSRSNGRARTMSP